MNSGRQSRRRWAALGVVGLLALLVGATLAWPRATRWMAAWTGEEDTVTQINGMANLLAIWATERPLALDADRPLPHTSLRPYCVSTFLEQEAEVDNVTRSLDLVQAAGIPFIRQQFPWEDIEIHGKGDFEDRRHEPYRSAWEKYDRIMDLADQRGVQVIARLDAPPDWTRADAAEHNLFGPPDQYEDYGDFVAAVVSRYKGRLKYLQIWNEPNIYPEWGDNPPDPEAYTRLLEVAARRARAIDPHIVIISAPLAPTLDRNERALRDLDYLDRMLQAGAADYFDILGIIAYGLGSGPDDHRAVWHRTNFARPQLLRDRLVRAGYGDKPAWILEMGWTAVPDDMDAPFGRVTLDQQARYTVGAYRRIEADYPWVGVGCLWYLRRPNDEWLRRPEGYFRLVSHDWQPLPAYTALKAEATAPAQLPTGFQHVSHPGFALSGPWRREANTRALLGTWQRGSPGATATFTFDGGGAALATQRGPMSGTLEIIVDGGPPTRVDLRAEDQAATDIPLADGQRAGQHAVTLRVVEGEVVLEGVRVSGVTEPPLRQGFLARPEAAVGGGWPVAQRAPWGARS